MRVDEFLQVPHKSQTRVERKVYPRFESLKNPPLADRNQFPSLVTQSKPGSNNHTPQGDR